MCIQCDGYDIMIWEVYLGCFCILISDHFHFFLAKMKNEYLVFSLSCCGLTSVDVVCRVVLILISTCVDVVVVVDMVTTYEPAALYSVECTLSEEFDVIVVVVWFEFNGFAFCGSLDTKATQSIFTSIHTHSSHKA